MAISYTNADIYTFPANLKGERAGGNPALSGYTGIHTYETPSVLTEFMFTLKHNWTISKVIETLWWTPFDSGPTKWIDIIPSGHPEVERPCDVYGRSHPNSPISRCVTQFPGGGFPGWRVYPNYYGDAAGGQGNLAGYHPYEGGYTSKWCMKVQTHGTPAVPAHFPTPGGYGGVAIDFNESGVVAKQVIGAWYRLSFYTKHLTGTNSKIVFDAQNWDSGVGDATNMRYEFTPTDNWAKHEHLFFLDKKTHRLAIWSSAPHRSFLLDDVKLEEVELTTAPPSRDVLWDFGDGTYGTGLTARHTYTWPGIYNVRSILYDQYGNQLVNNIVPSVSAYNVLDDWLELDYSLPNFTAEIPAGEMGFHDSTPGFKVNRTNSWQTFPSVSAAGGYSLFLHASGSLSNRLNVANFYNEKWSHLDQTWAFYKQKQTSAGTTDWEPISSIGTTSESIYYRVIDTDWNIAPCLSSDPGASFVGTSGTCTFKYIDDLPKHNFPNTKQTSTGSQEPPVLLIASFDTTNFPSSRAATITEKNTYNFTGLPLTEGPKLTIPIKTIPTPGKGFKITATGQSQMPISNIKWQGTPIPFFVSMTNNSGYVIETYPEMEGNYGTEVSFPEVININLQDNYGNIQPAGWYYDSLTQLPGKLKSRLFGFFVPGLPVYNMQTTGATLCAYMSLIRPFSGLSGIFTLPDPDRAYVGVPFQDGTNLHKVITLKNNVNPIGGTAIYTYDSNTIREIYGTATVIDRYDDVNPLTNTWVVDPQLDRIHKMDSNGSIILTISADDVISKVLYGDPFTPVSEISQISGSMGMLGIALDEGKDVWVTCKDAGTVSKFDGVSGQMLNLVYADELSAGLTTDTVSGLTGVAGPFVPYLNGLSGLEPGPIDIDVDSNVWVGYTNPLSSFVQKISSTGEVLSAYRYGFEVGERPVGIVADNQNNIFVITSFWGANYPTSTATLSSVSAYRDVNSSYQQFLTGMNPREDGITEYFGYKMSDPYNDALQSGVTAVSSLSSLSGISTFPLSSIAGYGAIRVEGFDDLRTIPGTSNQRCDSVFNTWGWHTGTLRGSSPDTTNNVFYITPHITKQYLEDCPEDYSANVTTVASSVLLTYHPGGRLYKFDSDTGSLVYTISGLYAPSYITVDRNQNVWVADHTDRIMGFKNRTGEQFANIQAGDDATILSTIGETLTAKLPYSKVLNYPVMQHIKGLDCTLTNRLNVINSLENRFYYIQLQGTNPNLITKSHITLDPSVEYNTTSQAYGDFTGFQWTNKYKIYPELYNTGNSVSFNVYPSGGLYNLTKFNEDFDASDTVKSYRMQEHLIDDNNFFNNLYGEIVGDGDAHPTEIGKLTYEKIANFLDNTNNIDTCEINALHSLANQHNVPIADFNFAYPPELRRVLNIGSISHKRLWGERSKFNENFDLDYGAGDIRPQNLGDIIPLTSKYQTALSNGVTAVSALSGLSGLPFSYNYMLTAGKPLVLRQLFNNEFKLIVPMVIDNAGTFGSGLYPTSQYPLTSYPLSSYSNSWGWNIDPNAVDDSVSGADLFNYFDFYEYKSGFDNTQKEGVIDWSGPGEIHEGRNSLSEWEGDWGMLENIIDHTIKSGTYMFEDSEINATKAPSQLDVNKLIPNIPVFNVSVDSERNTYNLNLSAIPTIYAKRGALIEFRTDATTSDEPFRIMKHPNGEIWTDGVTLVNNAAGAGGILKFVPPQTIPGMLYYGSANSYNMGYTIVFA